MLAMLSMQTTLTARRENALNEEEHAAVQMGDFVVASIDHEVDNLRMFYQRRQRRSDGAHARG